MAETYGKLPSEVFFADPTAHSRMDRFRFNSDVFAATNQYKEWQREAERENRESAEQGPGDATQREKDRLVDQQQARAERREQQEQTGDHATDTDDQLDALAAKRQERDQARSTAALEDAG